MLTTFQTDRRTGQATFLPRIARADKTAARECVDFYGAMIWTLTKQTIVSDEKAETVVQEIFRDIWDSAEFYDLDAADEKLWIAMIAYRRLEKYAEQVIL